jgi:hypothetical protein
MEKMPENHFDSALVYQNCDGKNAWNHFDHDGNTRHGANPSADAFFLFTAFSNVRITPQFEN